MKDLDFVELHKEKLDLIFENIEILSEMKESDTQLPERFFYEICSDVIYDYKLKMKLLNKNTKFCTKELKKDFNILRKVQKKKCAELRKQKALIASEMTIYVVPQDLFYKDDLDEMEKI